MSRHPRGQARLGRRPAETAAPCALFEPSPMPCRDCGETAGHAPRCPRHPDAEIIPEPVYAAREAVAVTDAAPPLEAWPREHAAAPVAVAVPEPADPPPAIPEVLTFDVGAGSAPVLAELDLGAAVLAPQHQVEPVDPAGASLLRTDEAPWLEAEEALRAEVTRRFLELFDQMARKATAGALAELSRRRGAP